MKYFGNVFYMVEKSVDLENWVFVDKSEFLLLSNCLEMIELMNSVSDKVRYRAVKITKEVVKE